MLIIQSKLIIAAKVYQFKYPNNMLIVLTFFWVLISFDNMHPLLQITHFFLTTWITRPLIGSVVTGTLVAANVNNAVVICGSCHRCGLQDSQTIPWKEEGRNHEIMVHGRNWTFYVYMSDMKVYLIGALVLQRKVFLDFQKKLSFRGGVKKKWYFWVGPTTNDP